MLIDNPATNNNTDVIIFLTHIFWRCICLFEQTNRSFLSSSSKKWGINIENNCTAMPI